MMSDQRGFFSKIFEKKKEFKKIKIDQICLSLTKKKGTIRGLHFQKYPNFERKIITCLKGKVFDVCVDIRRNSPHFMKFKTKILDGKKLDSIIIEKGFAHGFQSLDDNVLLLYCIDGKFIKNKQSGLFWKHPKLNINWPIKKITISKKDKSFKFL